MKLSPVGIEPTTLPLWAAHSTDELQAQKTITSTQNPKKLLITPNLIDDNLSSDIIF